MDEVNNPYVSPHVSMSRRRVKSWTDAPFESARTRGIIARFLIGLTTTGAILAIVVLNPLMNRERASATPNAPMLMASTFGILGCGIALPLIAGIGFCFWIHRAYRNLPSLGLKRPMYSPNWAVGGFFVPFLNLYRPWDAMAEIWSNSVPLPPLEAGQRRERVAAAIVTWWWATYLLSGFVGYASAIFEPVVRNVADSPFHLLYLLFHLTSAVLIILIIGRIDANQAVRAAQRSEMAPEVEPELNF